MQYDTLLRGDDEVGGRNHGRDHFNPIEETKLGETTIRSHLVVHNVWLFVGYRF